VTATGPLPRAPKVQSEAKSKLEQEVIMKAIWKTLCAAAMVGISIMPAQAADKAIKMGTLGGRI
jgi:hypothetical protein